MLLVPVRLGVVLVVPVAVVVVPVVVVVPTTAVVEPVPGVDDDVVEVESPVDTVSEEPPPQADSVKTEAKSSKWCFMGGVLNKWQVLGQTVSGNCGRNMD